MVREYPITLQSKGAQLVGMVHQPEREKIQTAVIFCHGFTGNKQENKRLFVEAARHLARLGYWALRFDFFGSGDSAGEFHESRISINIENLRDVIGWTQKEGFGRVVVLGISMGAATAILCAEQSPVDGLILWSAVPDFRELFEAKMGVPVEQVPRVEQFEYDGWLIDRQFFEEALGWDVRSAFRKLNLPVLMVQGGEDEPVFVKGFETFRSMNKSGVSFHFIPDAGHTFQTVRHRKQVIEVSADWLTRNFPP